MRKLAWFGLLLVATTGCGRGWLPTLFRGAPCGSTCGITGNALPTAAPGCTNCGTSAGYGSVDGDVMATDYYGGEVINGGYYGSGVVEYPGTVVEGTIVNPSMTPISPTPAS